jgi:hypothetical protein
VSYYTQKKSLVEVVKVADSDGFLQNEDTDYYPVSKNDIILKDGTGRLFTVTQEHFDQTYLNVEKVEKKKRTPSLSPFELEAMKNGYAEMGELIRQENEAREALHNDSQELIENKPF